MEPADAPKLGEGNLYLCCAARRMTTWLVRKSVWRVMQKPSRVTSSRPSVTRSWPARPGKPREYRAVYPESCRMRKILRERSSNGAGTHGRYATPSPALRLFKSMAPVSQLT